MIVCRVIFCSAGKRIQAFKYSVKAADYALSKSQFSRCFVYASRAKEMALGKTEITAVMDVLDTDIQLLEANVRQEGGEVSEASL